MTSYLGFTQYSRLKDMSANYLYKWVFLAYKICDPAKIGMINAIYKDASGVTINDINSMDTLGFNFEADTVSNKLVTLSFTTVTLTTVVFLKEIQFYSTMMSN